MSLGLSLKQLDEQVDSEEFVVWMKYFREEPYGPFGEYYRIGTLTAMLANVNMSDKKDFIRDPGVIFPSVDFPMFKDEEDASPERRAVAKSDKTAQTLRAGLPRMNETGESLRKRLRETVGRRG